MSYTTQNPERFIEAICETLAYEGVATVLKTLNAAKNWYATLDDAISDVLVLVESIPATATMSANPVTGLADPVYKPHVVKVGYRGPKKASGTVEVNGPAAGHTVVINGVAFTAKAALPIVMNEFVIGATDDETAINLAAAITASTSAGILNTVTVRSIGTGADADLITLNAYWGGLGGNALTLADGGAGTFAVSGATFTGGTDARTTTATLAKVLMEVASKGIQVEVYEKANGTDFLIADFGTYTPSVTIRNVPWGNIAHI